MSEKPYARRRKFLGVHSRLVIGKADLLSSQGLGSETRRNSLMANRLPSNVNKQLFLLAWLFIYFAPI